MSKMGVKLCQHHDFYFGVLIPINPAFEAFGHGTRFFPFEKYWLPGTWKEDPSPTKKDEYKPVIDVAICKIAPMAGGAAHQPLAMAVNAFIPGEAAYALGYAKMKDIPLIDSSTGITPRQLPKDIYASVGNITQMFPENHIDKNLWIPGPCFTFSALIPGGMSGGPIFGAQGLVIGGLVSGGTEERHAYGAMLGPALTLPLDEQDPRKTLRGLMEAGTEGMPRLPV